MVAVAGCGSRGLVIICRVIVPENIPDDAYEGLQALEDSRFPQVCSCDRVYHSMEDLLEQTQPTLGGRGLSEVPWTHGSAVGVWRNCECGTTLLVVCGSRRDDSSAGQQRRDAFDVQLQHLLEQGQEQETAKYQLRQEFRGLS